MGRNGAKAVSMPNPPTLVIMAVPKGSRGMPCEGRCRCNSLVAKSVSHSMGRNTHQGSVPIRLRLRS